MYACSLCLFTSNLIIHSFHLQDYLRSSTGIRIMSSAVDTTQKAENQRDNQDEPIVQYILIRTDLGWNSGAMIAQACHASIASISRTLDTPATRRYLEDLQNMHKVVLKADKLDDLIKTETKLKEANVPHHLWIEQPENLPTCLAASPQPKHLIQSIFKHFKLLK